MKPNTRLKWQRRALKQEKNLERLHKIVDKVLTQIFGENAALFIYRHLEEKHSLKQEDIPHELGTFSKGLERYLSDSGALVVLEALFNKSSQLKSRKVEERNFMEQLKELKRISHK